ncbi:hypothetical protein D8674_018455 [Pyrus ussuriensis x Pyrus communis]|uniref:PGG domain-containing protein n=1 Tax=Pyrus ussuriensis x Pyrus communis TaxID=2448454 RepID=A0A5N5G517_9ROSA|nr:hypothetical protein D8674_018455 [Pyrus ussuriensis x Pyrus communis]
MSNYQIEKLKEALCVASLFQIAVKCHQYNVYNLTCELLQKQDKYGLNQLDELKGMVGNKDRFLNNMLHMVARITPLSSIDHIQDPKDCESTNIDNKTPRKIFIENHKELEKEAENSMKETITSCTVVGAVNVTIMFATSFIVLRGNDENTCLTCLPKVFTTFILSNAILVFSSITLVIMFLGILTSRLFTLFLSIVTMMIVFSCGPYVILDGKSSIVIPSILLASVLVASFIWMQFPLLVDLSISTFGRGIFEGKQKNLF